MAIRGYTDALIELDIGMIDAAILTVLRDWWD